ncbi:MAG: hypothetical protein WCC35_18600, partial [Bradyrhizobium sp.]
ATTDAISANRRADKSERRGARYDGSEERSVGQSVIKASPEPELYRAGASTCKAQTWAFPPYGALAEELNFGNEQAILCDGLSQAE